MGSDEYEDVRKQFVKHTTLLTGIYVDGVWPMYWIVVPTVERKFFFGRKRLIAYLAKVKLLTPGVVIYDRRTL